MKCRRWKFSMKWVRNDHVHRCSGVFLAPTNWTTREVQRRLYAHYDLGTAEPVMYRLREVRWWEFWLR